MGNDNAASNQRVTNRELSLGIVHLSEKVEEYRDETKDYRHEVREWRHENEKRLREVEQAIPVLDTRLGGLKDRVNRWGLGNSLGAIIAAVLAAFGIRQQ